MEFNLLLPIAGFVVGLVVGMTGVGGGSLMTPALIFGMGVAPGVAVGTDLVFAAATKSVGVWKHRAAGNVDWRLTGLLAAGSLPAVAVSLVWLEGAASRELLDALVLPVLGVALLLTSAALAFKNRWVLRAQRRLRRSGAPSGLAVAGAGAALGVMVTLSSVGAGALGVTVLMLCRPTMPAERLVGTDLAHAFPLALAAGLGHWRLGTVDWVLLASLLAGSLPGIYGGSALTGRVPEPVLRGLLAVVLSMAAVTCFWVR